jgi:threonine aldolase
MNFASDNVTGIAPAILEAIARANAGTASSYGADEITQRLQARLEDLFEHELAILPVATGTAANALALAALTPPWGAVLCHQDAHIAVDEANAPEFYSGGAKLTLLPGAAGKLEAASLAKLLPGGLGVVHHAQPAVVSLTQATECGTLYRVDEVAAISAVAHEHGLSVHMDGARFANALATLGTSPADATWRAGVDALSLGATKNGALAAEVVILFDPAKRQELEFRRKRAGHLFSKMRFLSAQLEAYVTDDLWLRQARHANGAAARLARGLVQNQGCRLRYPVEANEIFIELPEPMITGLFAEGFQFHRWDGPTGQCIRLVTAWNTEETAIERMIAAARGFA